MVVKVVKEVVVANANKPTAAVTGAGGGLGRGHCARSRGKELPRLGTAMKPGEIADLREAIWWRCDSDPTATSQTKAQSGTGLAMSQRRLKPDSIFSSAMLEF